MVRMLLIIVFIMMALFAGCQRAAGVPEIDVTEVWSRPVAVSPAEAAAASPDSGMANMHHTGSNGVIYMVVENRGSADRLLRAHSEVCVVTEIHQTIMAGDRMMMQQTEGGLEIPAHGQVTLAPRGHHLMLIDLKRSLAVGDSFEVHLEFEKSGAKTVFSKVRQP